MRIDGNQVIYGSNSGVVSEKIGATFETLVARNVAIAQLVEGLPAALLACRCQLDVPRLYEAWIAAAFDAIPVVGKRIVVDPRDGELVHVDRLAAAAFYDALPLDGHAIRFR